MPRTLRWTSLIPGVLIVAAIIGISIAILMFAQVGALHGDTIRVFASMGQARGVIEGTEVWLNGQKIGLVTGVHFQPISVDTTRRVVLGMDVLEEYRHQLRTNSTAQVRAGGTLIGAQVVWLGAGTVDHPPLTDGDTILAKQQGDTEGVTARAAMASREFPAIIANIKLLAQLLTTAEGTLGAMGADGGGQPLAVFKDGAIGLRSAAISDSGSVGLALRWNLGARVGTAAARADSIRALLSDTATSLGRFRRDSTLLRTVEDVRNEVSVVRALLEESRGTAGRAVNDAAIVEQLAQLESELAVLMADIKRRPLRYISF